MAQRTRDIQTSWSNGVISPRILGRTELDKYYSSAEVVRDLIVLPQGGLKRRPGTQYVADAMGPSRLIPFVFSPGVAYIIELGNLAMRFYYAYNDQAQSPTGSFQPKWTIGQQIGVTAAAVSWNQAVGGTTSDGALTWTNEGSVSYGTLTNNGNATAVAAHKNIIDSNGNIQQCTTAGTTAHWLPTGFNAHPAWNAALGGTTSDGSVTWTNEGNPAWVGNTTYASNAVVYTPYGVQMVTAGGGGASGVGSSVFIPTQLSTPFDTSVISLWDIQYAQQGDIMYFTHPFYPVQKLERFGVSGAVPSASDNNWRLVQPQFYCPPTDQFDQDVSGGTITMTPAATAGTGVNFTASAAVFLAGDVGKFIVADTQIALITSITSTTVAVANILGSFLSTSAIAAGSWKLRGSPSTFLGIGTNSTNFLADNQFGVGQSVTAFSFAKWPDNSSASPATSDCFRSTDVGRYMNAAGCISQITAVNSAHEVTMTYLSVPENTFTGTAGTVRVSPSASGAWSIEDAIWTGNNGFPGCCAFFQNRLLLASTTQQPKTVWGSRSDDYENFAKGTNEGDALDFTISGGKLDTIQWMSGTPVQGRLAIETDAGEYIAYAGGANGDAITPTSINVQPNSSQGGCKLLPILTDAVLIYIQRYRTKIFEFSYNIYQSSFASKDLSLYAEHLTHAGVKEIAWQANPYKIIWMVTFDGRMLGMTYDRTQDVCAWHEHRTGYADQGYGAVGTGDSFISVASIPNPSTVLLGTNGNLAYAGNASSTYSSDLVWTVVKRKRGLSTAYTIELMNEDLLVDCHDPINTTAVFDSTNLVETITSSALKGRLVVATGKPGNAVNAYFPFDSPLAAAQAASATVPFGKITIPMNVALASLTSYGLPFQPTLVTRRAESRQGGPTQQGVLKRWSDLWIRVYNTLGLTINGQSVPFSNLAGVLPSVPADSLEPGVPNVVGTSNTMSDEMAPLATDVRVFQLGYDRLGRVTIIQPQPLPVALLAMFGTLYIGDQ